MWNPYNTNQFTSNFSPYYNSPTPTPSSSGINFSSQSQNNSPSFTRPQNNIIWVTGKENARSMQLQPNSTVILLDNDSNKFYIKTTDDIGLGKLRVFNYTEQLDQPTTQQQSTNQPSIDASQFVTKQELEKMIAKLKGELKNDKPISTTKQNDKSKSDSIILTK